MNDNRIRLWFQSNLLTVVHDHTFFACDVRGKMTSKRLCSRSKYFGILSNGMFPHFLISQRLKYVANEHINAKLEYDRENKEERQYLIVKSFS
jgi:hypothetical protein